jgi:hypothetical protein
MSCQGILRTMADCYTIEQYNKTYKHHMLPMDGMSTWLIYDHPRPSALGYVIMPGRPRKERRRDPSEAKKNMKLSKAATTTTKMHSNNGAIFVVVTCLGWTVTVVVSSCGRP